MADVLPEVVVEVPVSKVEDTYRKLERLAVYDPIVARALEIRRRKARLDQRVEAVPLELLVDLVESLSIRVSEVERELIERILKESR